MNQDAFQAIWISLKVAAVATLIVLPPGVAAGWLNVMAGGGSLLTVPVMLFMGVPAPVANGTNRIAILAQNISAVTAFRPRSSATPSGSKPDSA